MSNELLKDIVRRARVADYGSTRGYRIYAQDSLGDRLTGDFYWLFRNVVRTQVIPVHHEIIIALRAAMLTGNGPSDWSQVGQYQNFRLTIKSDKSSEFEEIFRIGMGAYLEERHYVTRPEEALLRTQVRMDKAKKSQDTKK